MPDSALSRIESDLRAVISDVTGDAASLEVGSVEPMTGGFDTQVFALRVSGGSALPSRLVLRLFRHEREGGRAVLEATVHNAAADGDRPRPPA